MLLGKYIQNQFKGVFLFIFQISLGANFWVWIFLLSTLVTHETLFFTYFDAHQPNPVANIQGVTEIQVQNWTMPIKTKNKTLYKNDKKRLTA